MLGNLDRFWAKEFSGKSSSLDLDLEPSLTDVSTMNAIEE